MESNRASSNSRFSKWLLKRRKQKKTRQQSQQPVVEDESVKSLGKRGENLDKRFPDTRKSINAPLNGLPKKKDQQEKKHRRVVSSIRNMSSATARVSFDEKPLFLQEAAHLLSLLSAVAMSTLRNDLETAESPLITFTPGRHIIRESAALQAVLCCLADTVCVPSFYCRGSLSLRRSRQYDGRHSRRVAVVFGPDLVSNPSVPVWLVPE